MTYNEDPNINRRSPVVDAKSSTGMWIAGAAAAALVLGLIVYSVSGPSNVASTDRPTVTTPATTTGAGNTGNPAGNATTKPVTTPPVTTPPANR